MNILTNDKISQLLEITESYQAPERMLKLMLDDEKRPELFKRFIDVEWKLGREWFLTYFQEEHADRKRKKQDFTPDSISRLLSEMIGGGKHYFEVAAGTGTLLIHAWDKNRKLAGPARYDPRAYWYQAEELSDRAVPFLIFNMAIRGMNGTILHGDSLTRDFKNVYFIRNDTPDYMAFSEVIIMPKTEKLMKELDIRSWVK